MYHWLEDYAPVQIYCFYHYRYYAYLYLGLYNDLSYTRIDTSSTTLESILSSVSINCTRYYFIDDTNNITDWNNTRLRYATLAAYRYNIACCNALLYGARANWDGNVDLYQISYINETVSISRVANHAAKLNQKYFTTFTISPGASYSLTIGNIPQGILVIGSSDPSIRYGIYGIFHGWQSNNCIAITQSNLTASYDGTNVTLTNTHSQWGAECTAVLMYA